jgi:nitroimidazol reductase NimA-like FMN-containing flavoprotein (pyridoxamine 5'-phosphate oxidase superfamily)
MHTELRRRERALSSEEALELLGRGEYGVLSTISADGSPYGVPVNYCVGNGYVYFHCAVEGHKLENIAGDNRVSFCVVGATELLPDQFATRYESVIVSGHAEELFDAEKQRALEGLVEKYSSRFMQEGMRYIEAQTGRTRVFRFEIAEISGKARR